MLILYRYAQCVHCTHAYPHTVAVYRWKPIFMQATSNSKLENVCLLFRNDWIALAVRMHLPLRRIIKIHFVYFLSYSCHSMLWYTVTDIELLFFCDCIYRLCIRIRITMLFEFIWRMRFPCLLMFFFVSLENKIWYRCRLHFDLFLQLEIECTWMRETNIDWIFQGPACAVLLINLIFLFRIMWVSGICIYFWLSYTFSISSGLVNTFFESVIELILGRFQSVWANK